MVDFAAAAAAAVVVDVDVDVDVVVVHGAVKVIRRRGNVPSSML